jgi:glycopeptide antibiotics resistance protein
MTARYWRLMAWASTVGVLVMCFTPGSSVPTQQIFQADKFFHVLAFLIVGYAWRRSGVSTTRALVIGLLLAVGTEVGQSLLDVGREGDLLDVLADVIGTLLGVLMAARLRAPQAPS